jgi:hypothetical protein
MHIVREEQVLEQREATNAGPFEANLIYAQPHLFEIAGNVSYK